MNKTIVIMTIIVMLPIILGISFFVIKDNVSVQKLTPETLPETTNEDITYSDSTALLTGDIR